MGPWYEAHDPRNACDNDHEYRYDTGTWRASLAEALADAGATGYTYYVTWSIGGVGAQFYALDGAIDPEENMILYFHMVPQGWIGAGSVLVGSVTPGENFDHPLAY